MFAAENATPDVVGGVDAATDVVVGAVEIVASDATPDVVDSSDATPNVAVIGHVTPHHSVVCARDEHAPATPALVWRQWVVVDAASDGSLFLEQLAPDRAVGVE